MYLATIRAVSTAGRGRVADVPEHAEPFLCPEAGFEQASSDAREIVNLNEKWISQRGGAG